MPPIPDRRRMIAGGRIQVLEIPRRHSDRSIASFAYRLASPVFSGTTVLVHGSRNEDGRVALSGMVDGGGTSITGMVTLA